MREGEGEVMKEGEVIRLVGDVMQGLDSLYIVRRSSLSVEKQSRAGGAGEK